MLGPLPIPSRWPLLLLLVAGLSLRLFRIDQEPIHIDELFTQDAAVGSLRGHMFEEATPPLYFAVMKAWSHAVGGSVAGMRVFSAVVGAIATVMLVLAARELGAAYPFMVGILLAVLPLAVWYGQVARAYSLASLSVCAWLWAVARVLHDDHRKLPVACLAGTVSIGLLTHYYFALLLFVPCSVLLVASRVWPEDRGVRRLLIGHAAALPCAAAMAMLAGFQLHSGRASWVPRPTTGDLLSVPFETFLVGPFRWPSPLLEAIAIVAVLALAVSTVIAARRCFRRDRRARLMAILLLATAVPSATVIPWVLSLGPRAIFVPYRYTIVALPPFLLLPFVAATSFGKNLRRAIAGAATVVVLGAGAWGLSQLYTTLQDFDWRAASRLIGGSPQHAVLFLPAWLERPLRANGGQDVTAIAPRGVAHRSAGFWMLSWEGSPRPATRRIAEEFARRPDAELVLESHSFRLHRVPAP